MTQEPKPIPRGTVLVVDYGGQYTHLLARRFRELGVLSLVEPYYKVKQLDLRDYPAIVLSGDHGGAALASGEVEESAERILREALAPVLGVNYGHLLLAKVLGGGLSGGCSEYGRTRIKIVTRNELFSGWSSEEEVWMNHSECVSGLPPGGTVLAVSENGVLAAFKVVVNNRPIYGVQFHPEASHTSKGLVLLENFIELANLERKWRKELYYEQAIAELEKHAREGGVVVAAVSGGLDSTVSALLAKRVFGERLVPVFVNHGLFREGEVEEVLEVLKSVGLKPLFLDASERFLSRLEGVADCEARRAIIGEEFAKVFDEVMEELGARLFVQGTIYPDVVESGFTGAGKVKTHHNVAGLPAWFREKYTVVEPLKYLYKDEVRELARMLGLPEHFIYKHPFPGPGLAARVVGPFTRKKLEVCRKASAVVEKVLKKHGLYEKVWQAFAVVGDDTWVGVKGGARKQGFVVIVRVVESTDAMTADYAKLPYHVLDEISREITRSIDDVTMVTYAITTKPPSTIEPC